MLWFIKQAVLLLTGLVVVAAGAIWAALLGIQAVLGLASMPSDYDATASWVEMTFKWLLRQDPTAASWMMACALMLVGLFVLGYFWSRGHERKIPAFRSPSAPKPAPTPAVDIAPAATATERQAKDELARFVARHVIPAFDAQSELQRAILHVLCVHLPGVERQAQVGLSRSSIAQKVGNALEELKVSVIINNGDSISLDNLMQRVLFLSKAYDGFCGVRRDLCHDTGVDPSADPRLQGPYQDWNKLNEPLEREYARFQSDRRFNALYTLSEDRRYGQAFATTA